MKHEVSGAARRVTRSRSDRLGPAASESGPTAHVPAHVPAQRVLVTRGPEVVSRKEAATALGLAQHHPPPQPATRLPAAITSATKRAFVQMRSPHVERVTATSGRFQEWPPGSDNTGPSKPRAAPQVAALMFMTD